MHEATMSTSISARGCQVILFIYCCYSPCGNAACYLLQATIFLGSLELRADIINVGPESPRRTSDDDADDDDEDPVEGR